MAEGSGMDTGEGSRVVSEGTKRRGDLSSGDEIVAIILVKIGENIV